jgi:hypothetical protein
MDTQSLNHLYKTVDVWRRIDSTQAVRYRCFQILDNNKFCVQSKDYYPLPIDKSHESYLENQFLELYLEEAPEDRTGMYSSLEEAIKMFDKDFG